MSSFKDFYTPTLEKDTGFKLVLGGTGIGKTSAIPEIIKENPTKRKYIYIANRIQLLQEMRERLEGEEIGYAWQKNDYDLVKECDLKELFSNEIIIKYIPFLKAQNIPLSKLSAVQKDYFFIKDPKNEGLQYTEEGLNIFRQKTSTILRFFKQIISTAYRVSKGKININSAIEISQNDFEEIIKLSVIQSLFPYIAYKYDPAIRIFLVTIQKAYYGFFDGSLSVTLASLDDNHGEKNGDRIIFLDEFDFLENDLLNLITQDVEINRPFDFVRQFYIGIKINKYPYENFLKDFPEVKEPIDLVIENIESLKEKFDIDYPSICHFTCTDESKKIKGTSIFQTRYSVSNYTFYLDATKRANSFDLTLNRGDRKATAFTLLDVVNRATAEIIRIFKELEHSNPRVYSELVNFCFKNSQAFQKIIRQVKQYPYRTQRKGSNYDKLQLNGFGLYEVHDLGFITDDQEVEFKYYALFSTPEKLLWHLVKNNLVFGLSATADIPRLIKNFDLRWLQKIAKEKYYETEDSDIQLIAEINTEKQSYRSNQISLYPAYSLTKEDEKQDAILGFIQAIGNLEHTGPDDKPILNGKWKKKRVVDFFATLYWIIEHRKVELTKDSHLLYFNSYRQIKYVLDTFPDGGEDNLFEVTKNNEDNLFDYYELVIEKQDFLLVFYNSEKGKLIQQNEVEKQRFYELFWQEKPVLLITTYPSTGNGINLQYYSKSSMLEKKDRPDNDFLNIHLLDAPYYYFSPIDTEHQTNQEINSIIKSNIYYLAKLEKGGLMHKNHFKRHLSNIRGIDKFNANYLKFPDGILNGLAVCIQALGRIERIWEKMDHQNIRLSKEVLDIFEQVVSQEQYVYIHQELLKYCSGNIKKLLKLVSVNYSKTHTLSQEYKNETLVTKNKRCRNSIRELLDKLNWVRKHPASPKCQDIRKEWNTLRELALKHFFYRDSVPLNQSLLYKYHCIFEDIDNDYDSINECFWINEDQEIVHRKYATSNFNPWNLNDIYNKVNRSTIIASYFDKNEYNYGFDNKGKYFTPYFFQSILIGAIGEEAIKAIFPWEQIPLSESEIPNELFELADTKIQGKPWYIDCKNYSHHTILQFPIQTEEGSYVHHKLNEQYFKESAAKKLAAIEAHHKDEDCKLIYINAFGDMDLPIQFLDSNFNALDKNDFDSAKIIFIHEMLDRTNPNKRNKDFEDLFINVLKKHFHAHH